MIKERLFSHIGNEKDIENHLIDNIDDISIGCFWGPVEKFQKQLRLDMKGFSPVCDLMIWHGDGTGTVVEVKKFKNELSQSHAIGQILMYGEAIKLKLSEYPRLVICSDYISPIIKSIISAQKLPIKTLQLDGDKVTYS